MTAPTAPAGPRVGGHSDVPRWVATTGRKKVIGLLLALVALGVIALFSIAVGSRYIPPGEVLQVLLHPDDSQASTIVHSLRVPRTALGIAVGMALGVAGAVMQALTRNPLADPGLLGVNAGAAVAVVIGIGTFGIGSALGYLPFAFAGAAIASVVVYLLGSAGRSGATPGPTGAGRGRRHGRADRRHRRADVARPGHLRPVPILGRRIAERPRP